MRLAPSINHQHKREANPVKPTTPRSLMHRGAWALALALALWSVPARGTTKFDRSPFIFTSGGVDYYGLEFLVHEPGIGNIWVAIPKNHDLESGPVSLLFVLDPDPPQGRDVDPSITAEERPSIRALHDQMQKLLHDPRGAMKSARPLLGEIRLWAGNVEPPGWLFCDGRLLALYYYPDLYELIGNTYGGDGRTTFALPDLRGRVPMGRGAGAGLTNRELGQKTGAESVTLSVNQLPAHDHNLRASNSSATQTQPAGNVLATASTPQYLNAATSVNMGSDAIGSTGSNEPHPNVQPSTVLNFIMAVDAGRARPVYPSAAKWPVTVGSTPPRWKMRCAEGSAVKIECDAYTQPPFNSELTWFSSGGVDYSIVDFLEHEDGVGSIWLAIPKNHDFESSPVTPLVVLSPDAIEGDWIPWPDWVDDNTNGVQDEGESWVDANGNGVRDSGEAVTPGGDGRTTWRMGNKLVAISEVSRKLGMCGWNRGQEFRYSPPARFDSYTFLDEWEFKDLPPQGKALTSPAVPPAIEPTATRLDTHAGMAFTSGGVDYLGIELLECEPGIGTIWVAIPKNHDLEAGPVTPLIVLNPDVLRPP